MKPEQLFHQWIKANVPGHHQRIESNTCNGIPDINVCYQGAEVWLELKVPVNGRVLLRKEQYAWGLRRAVNGGSTYILANFSNVIYIWKFQAKPFSVEQYGKYVWLREMPLYRIPRDQVNDIVRALFDL